MSKQFIEKQANKINDYLVYKFLDNKISFEELNDMLIKFILSSR